MKTQAEAIAVLPSPSGMSDGLAQMADALSKRQSVVGHVEEALRELIVTGRLKPGERIVETRVARQLGIGQPAVREALKTLEAEGLVMREMHRGCSVITLSEAEIEQIFTLRVELEVLAVKLAVKALSGAGKEKLDPLFAVLAKMQHAAQAGEARTFYTHDLELHRTLWRLAGNPYLERALSQITVPLFAFAMIEISSHAAINLKADAERHGKIVKAVASGDARRAMHTMRVILNLFRKEGHMIIQQGK